MEPGYEDDYSVLEESHPWFVSRRELFGKLAGQDRDDRILDVGCGTGIFLVHLRRRGYARLAGVETSANLRAKFREPAIELFEDLPDGPYDQVFLLDVLEHVEDDRGMLARIHALLEPGGRLLVSVPAHPSLWSRHDELNRHCRRYRRRELRRKLAAAGFRIRRLSYWNMLSFPPIWLLRRLRLGERKNQLEIGGRLAMRLYGAVLRLENRLLQRVSLPMGVSLIAVAEKPRRPRGG